MEMNNNTFITPLPTPPFACNCNCPAQPDILKPVPGPGPFPPGERFAPVLGPLVLGRGDQDACITRKDIAQVIDQILTDVYRPLVPEISWVTVPADYQDEDAWRQAIDGLWEREGDYLAGFIVEPVMASGGVVPIPAPVLQQFDREGAGG